jgi:glutamate synthase (NADPH/NADH) small chain
MQESDDQYGPTGENVVLHCDRVLKAIGQQFVNDLGGSDDGQAGTGQTGTTRIELKQGRIKVDAERRTSDTHVWAGGDCIAGGQDLTVSAVQDGKLAAESIHQMLSSKRS